MMRVLSWKKIEVEADPWLAQRFGDHYAQISADTTLKLKSSVKDVARVLHGTVPPEIEDLTKGFMMPPQGISDADFVFGYKANDEWVPGSLEKDLFLQKYVERFPREWEIVQKCLGIARQKTRHACAFVIANKPIHEFIPLMEIGGVKCTQYTAGSVEASGGLKMDFLVINSLRDIQDCIRMIQERSYADFPESLVLNQRKVPKHRLIPAPGLINHGRTVILDVMQDVTFYDIWDLPTDQAVCREVSEGNTPTVFQFNTPGAVKWLQHFNRWKDRAAGRKAIDSIEAMSAFTALDRPGPLDATVEGPDGRTHNMLVEYARRARGEDAVGSLPVFMELFPETYGVLTYQEQLQKAYQNLTGCTGPEAEEFRTNVAKKKMDKVLKAFIPWMERVGPKLGEQVAKTVWDTFVTWGQYGFNKTMDQSTILVSGNGERKRLMDFEPGETIRCVDENGLESLTGVVALHDHGEMMGWEVEFDDGHRVVVSSHHKFLTPEGQKPLHEIVDQGLEVLSGVSMEESCRGGADGVRPEGTKEGARSAQEGLCGLCGCKGGQHPSAHDQAQRPARAESSCVRCRDKDLRSAGHPAGASGEDARLAGGAPGGNTGHLGIGQEGGQEVQDGGVASVNRGSDLGRCADPLWREEEAGGLRIPGSQDLGGSGRILPLLRSIESSPAPSHGSIAGCDAERGGSSPQGCDIDPAFRAMLPFFRRADDGRVAPVAYSDAPLASSGSLVLRHIVRVRSVGLVRMCDLEVAHPKHNFLLPNGVVTSNSHSICYVHIAYACAYLKHHYPLEWWCSVLGNADKNEVTETFWRHCGHLVDLPDVNLSSTKFRISGERIQAPVSLIKGVGETAHTQLLANAPYTSIEHFCEKIEAACVNGKVPSIDKATGLQKVTKKGELCWRKARSALTRGVVHRLIAAGVMDSLFPKDSDLAERIFAYETALSASKGEKKITPVPREYLTYSPVRTFLLRKSVLPVYSEPLLPLLAEGNPSGYPQMALKSGLKPTFKWNQQEIPVISHERLVRLEQVDPWPDEVRAIVAVPVYVSDRKPFNWGPEKAKEALRLNLEMDGVPCEYVKWGDRKTGLLDAMYKRNITGAIGLAILSKYTGSRPFGLDELVLFHLNPAVKGGDSEQEDESEDAG